MLRLNSVFSLKNSNVEENSSRAGKDLDFPELWKALKSDPSARFVELGERSGNWSQSKEIGSEIARTFDVLVVIGIGGSSLGTQSILDFLRSRLSSKKTVYFLDSIDPLTYENFKEGLSKDKLPHFYVVSKSGETLEVLALLQKVCEDFPELSAHPEKFVTVATQTGKNPLRTWAESKSVRVVNLDPQVGGRFSSLSPVGLVPAAFADVNLQELQKGVLLASTPENKKLVENLVQEIFWLLQNQKSLTLFWCYGDATLRTLYWLQQLWSESLGKKSSQPVSQGSRLVSSVTASFPIVARGTSEQHSILQQVLDGPANLFLLTFRSDELERVGEPLLRDLAQNSGYRLESQTLGSLFEQNAEALHSALRERSVPFLDLRLTRYDEETLGHMMMTLQLVISLLGYALRVNPFDQPAVEILKKYARRLLSN